MNGKNIVIIGASGFIGSAIMKEALNRGHKVTAIVRHAHRIKEKNADLTVKEADVLNSDISDLLKGADAVISAYNPGWGEANLDKDIKKGYNAIIKAVKESKVPRLLVVGGAGSLYIQKGITVLEAGMIDEAIVPAAKAMADVYDELNKLSDETEWTFFSPAGDIEHGKRTGKYKLDNDNLILDNQDNSKISVEDYAKAMIDELENPEHSRERFTIGYEVAEEQIR